MFLGWYVSHDYVIADPRRIQKVKDFKFPDSKKAVRAFLGLVNSLTLFLLTYMPPLFLLSNVIYDIVFLLSVYPPIPAYQC